MEEHKMDNVAIVLLVELKEKFVNWQIEGHKSSVLHSWLPLGFENCCTLLAVPTISTTVLCEGCQIKIHNYTPYSRLCAFEQPGVI